MDILDSKTEEQLLKTLLEEIAKSRNEIRCAKNDIDKANSRLAFALVLINNLINRKED
jgi:hypothetical protein